MSGTSERSRLMLGGKIHRATVTAADLHYEGSIALDRDLMDAAGILEWEQVHVLDVTNGARLQTYAIEAPAGSGEICVNGAAAHLVNPGDLVIVLNFVQVPESELDTYRPRLVHVDAHNRQTEAGTPNHSWEREAVGTEATR
ncbi:MAG: aspartate 1-decarboxylase [Dehalococcoidia bacterium]